MQTIVITYFSFFFFLVQCDGGDYGVNSIIEQKLHKIYCSLGGYWKGLAAITELSDAAGVSTTVAKEWLLHHPIFQIHLSSPSKIIRPHFEECIPNHTNQIDLLYLPHDTIRCKRYKYALTVVDIASRYKDAEPLTCKDALSTAVAEPVVDNRGPLTFPQLT